MGSRKRDQKTNDNQHAQDNSAELPWAVVYYLTPEGGGKWEAMHGAMGGWYEIRLTGPGREQFRLFCLLENGTRDEIAKRGLPRPAIAVITGMRKPWRTPFSDRDYKHVSDLGNEHQRTTRAG